jgi:hypothetical protein
MMGTELSWAKRKVSGMGLVPPERFISRDCLIELKTPNSNSSTLRVACT